MGHGPKAASTFWTGALVGAVGLAGVAAGVVCVLSWILGGGCNG
jgi:hypothetical protein